MHVATLSTQRQVTLPKFLLDLINVDVKAKLIITFSHGGLFIRPVEKSITDELAGSLARFISPEKRNVPFEEAQREAMKTVAEEIAHEGVSN